MCFLYLLWLFTNLNLSLAQDQTQDQMTLHFPVLLEQLLQKNANLIENKTLLNQAQIIYNSNARFNIPEFTASAEQSNTAFKQTSDPTYNVDLDLQTYKFGLNGALPRGGLEYTLLFSKNDQDQGAYIISPAIQKRGKELSAELGINLLEDAGYNVGNILFDQTKLQYKLSQANYNYIEQQTLLDLIARYLDVCVLQEKLSSTKKILSQAQKLYEGYQALFNEGRISKVDFLSSSIQLNSLRSNLLSLNIAFREAKRSLFTLVGGYGDEEINKDYSFTSLKEDFLSDGLVIDKMNSETIYNKNPELLTLESQRKLAQLNVTSLENKVLPTLKFTGGYARNENPVVSLIDTSASITSRWYVGLNLSLPINNVAARADLSAQRIQKSNLELRSNLLKKTIDLKIQGLKNEIKDIESRLKILKDTEKLSNQRYDAAVPLTKVSASARIDIFTFQNQLIETQFEISELRAAYIVKKSEVLMQNGELSNKLLKE